MANSGETKQKFGRQYTFLNPDASVGPGVWRLSTIDEIAAIHGDGGGGIGDIGGVVPITSTTVGANAIDISIDISNLPDK